MPEEIEKMTDEEIIKWQEELYELEEQAGGFFAGPPMTEVEKMERIRAFLADDYLEKFNAKISARKKALVQEIAAESNPKKKERLQRNLALLCDS